ncbi:MAG: cyclic GMP-AMP synthase DncV-like nucleotidyltransferase [Candidatus Izemoplasmataceae bacterium]
MYKKELNKFIDKITIKSKKREDLRISRNNIQKTINGNFYSDYTLEFRGQGSFNMHTLIHPVEGKKYDLDYGVFIVCNSDERGTFDKPQKVKQKMKDVVDSLTGPRTDIKKSCVRVNFSSKSYHIDIPIYLRIGEKNYLARENDKWLESYPQENTTWFSDKVKQKGENLRSVIKLFKAWKEHKTLKFSGLALTILLSDIYIADNDMFHSFSYCAIQLKNKLQFSFSCIKPYKPYNNVIEDLTATQQRVFLEALDKLIEYLGKIENSEKIDEVNNNFRYIFGPRFDQVIEIDESKLKKNKSKPLMYNKNETGNFNC